MVFKCLTLLYSMGHQALLSQIVPVLKVTMVVLYRGQHEDKGTEMVHYLVFVILMSESNSFSFCRNSSKSDSSLGQYQEGLPCRV